MKKRAIHGVRKLVLRARFAASQFLFACRPHARGAGRRAASLIWRRKPKPTGSLHASRTTPLHTIWAPQLHLHFSVQAGEKMARALTAKKSAPNTTRPALRQFVRNRYQTNLRILATATPISPALRSLQILYGQGSVPQAARVLSPRRPQPPTLSLPTLRSHRIRLSEQHRRTQFVSQTEMTLATKTLALTTTEHEHNTQELRFRAVVTAKAAPPRSLRSQQRQLQIAHTPELVWRRPAKPPSPDVEDQARPASTLTPSSVRSQRATTIVAPEQPIFASAQTHPQNLDPGFMDRLTDDVIRRVEKRVRIERERRGL